MAITNDTCPKCGALFSYRGPSSVYLGKTFVSWRCGRGEYSHGHITEGERCRIRQLENAIRTHRNQKADDRCIEDDDRLYEALGDGVKCDRRVGDQHQSC